MNHPNIPIIDVETLKELRETNHTLTLIDVREQSEWDQMHIPGAIHIPKDQLAEKIHSITTDKQAPIYLHCHSGIRSLQAAEYLQEIGFNNVYSVKGGIMGWAMAGFPVEEQ